MAAPAKQIRRPLPARRCALWLCILALSVPLGARAGDAEDALAGDAVRVLREVMQAPDRAIPRELLSGAEAIAVIPEVIKAGLFFGGRSGEGLIAVRTAEGTWSNPVFIRLRGGSVGFQAGVSATDVVLVFRSGRSVDSIVHGKFTLGADAAVAAGPVGRATQAATDIQLRAEVFSWSRSRGLFAGVALDGTSLRIDHRADREAYGEDATPQRIFEGDVVRVPAAAVDFRDQLEEYGAR